MPAALNWPLMASNVSRAALDNVIEFLKQDDPVLTQSAQVRAFEEEWSAWLGVRDSVFVNSGASANLVTITALRETRGLGEVIVPTLTWVSDIASVIQCGFTPVFVDINPRTLGMDAGDVLGRITSRTRAVFLTHVLGYNALTLELVDGLNAHDVPLIEDVSESYGATFGGRKLGTFGVAANFSFYYAHHLTTIEGGMISSNDSEICDVARMCRSHGMVRESRSETTKRRFSASYPDLNPDFIFAYPGFNVRSTEINAVIGRAQLKQLDADNERRRENLRIFFDHLDPEKYQTDFETAGSCNYAFTLVLKHPDSEFCNRVVQLLRDLRVEFRRGTAGGGNQLRQPYLRRLVPDIDPTAFPHVDHIHFYGFYIGNYPSLNQDKILALCSALNTIPTRTREAESLRSRPSDSEVRAMRGGGAPRDK